MFGVGYTCRPAGIASISSSESMAALGLESNVVVDE